MVTQEQIARRYGISLSRVRVLAMDRDFAPVERVGGKTNRKNYYDGRAVKLWWQARKARMKKARGRK